MAKLAGVLNVELKDFFEFAREAENPKELKGVLNALMKEATLDKLKIAVKILRAIVR